MFKEVSVLSSTKARDPQPTSKLTIIGRVAVAAFAILMVGQSVGCARHKSALREAVLISYRDAVWARRAYNLRYGNCQRPYSDHFENGFCSGYSDVCDGGDGYVPAMPPADYRSYQYQCAEGAQCVNAWFEGYPAGVAAARKDDVGNYNDVLISRMINSAVSQEKSGNKLPGEVPVVGTQSNSRTSEMSPPIPPSIPDSPKLGPLPFALSIPTTATEMIPQVENAMPIQQVASFPTDAPQWPIELPQMPETGAEYSVMTQEISVATDANNNAINLPPIKLPPIISASAERRMVESSSYGSVPPIVTGSGVAPREINTPLPMSVNGSGHDSSRQSNRRSR